MRLLTLVVARSCAWLESLPDSAPGPNPVAALVARLEEVLLSGQQERYLDLLSASADREAAASFADSVFLPGASRVVIRERDRADLVGTLPGDGYQLLVEVLVETGSRRPPGHLAPRRPARRGATTGASRWGIANQELAHRARRALPPVAQPGQAVRGRGPGHRRPRTCKLVAGRGIGVRRRT